MATGLALVCSPWTNLPIRSGQRPLLVGGSSCLSMQIRLCHCLLIVLRVSGPPPQADYSSKEDFQHIVNQMYIIMVCAPCQGVALFSDQPATAPDCSLILWILVLVLVLCIAGV